MGVADRGWCDPDLDPARRRADPSRVTTPARRRPCAWAGKRRRAPCVGAESAVRGRGERRAWAGKRRPLEERPRVRCAKMRGPDRRVRFVNAGVLEVELAQPPVALKLPRTDVVHGETLVDDYFWL